MAESGTAVRYAAANVRQLLLDEAARRWTANAAELRVESKQVVAGDGRTLGYGELAAGINLIIPARADVPLTPTEAFALLGTDLLPRVDIPGKVTGAPAYVHDLRPEGLLHARVVRPPSPAAELVAVDTGAVEAMRGFVAVVRDGSFLAVVAKREFQAVLAMRALAAAAEWRERESLPEQSRLFDVLRELETEVGTVAETGSPQVPDGERTRRMTFSRPYMMHGSIGPSCAVALMDGDALTSGRTPRAYIRTARRLPSCSACRSSGCASSTQEGAGCYGHNGADDAAADAALIARALPGRPVRVQWTREQEHGWEPYGPAMTMDIAGTVGEDGRISHFTYDLWSNSHSTRPGGAARLIAAQHLANPIPFDLPG